MFFEDKAIKQAWADLVVCSKFILVCCGLAVSSCGIGVGFGWCSKNFVDDYLKGKKDTP